MKFGRNRMIVDLPAEVQMAIRLRAIKAGVTTGEVVSRAIEQVFGSDLEEAKIILAERNKS